MNYMCSSMTFRNCIPEVRTDLLYNRFSNIYNWRFYNHPNRARPYCATSLHLQALEPVLGGDCHFTPEDPSDENDTRAVLCQHLSSRLLEGVAESRAVLLLQTHSAYTDALTLLELYWAIRQKKTIICLRLQGQPYDFGEVLSPIP